MPTETTIPNDKLLIHDSTMNKTREAHDVRNMELHNKEK